MKIVKATLEVAVHDSWSDQAHTRRQYSVDAIDITHTYGSTMMGRTCEMRYYLEGKLRLWKVSMAEMVAASGAPIGVD